MESNSGRKEEGNWSIAWGCLVQGMTISWHGAYLEYAVETLGARFGVDVLKERD